MPTGTKAVWCLHGRCQHRPPTSRSPFGCKAVVHAGTLSVLRTTPSQEKSRKNPVTKLVFWWYENRCQGTSMATPVVAGNGAMARQYFREGWYNTGSKNETLGFDPSAALLKAVLINSATAMTYAGVNPDSGTLDVTLSEPPDEHQV